MMNLVFSQWFNVLPLWIVFALTLAICVGSVEAGAALARMVLRHNKEPEPPGPLGSLVAAVLALLAFFLAFTFGLAASRFDARRQLLLDEANAIGTTYLRAGFLPPSQQAEVRRLLREYADIRVKLSPQNAQETVSQSEAIHRQLWSQAESLAKENMDPPLRSIFVESLNEMIDLHQSRKTVGLQYQIPGSIWFAVYLITTLSMLTVGYQIGMSGTRRLRGVPLLAAAFSLAILTIADVDRPGEGLLRVSQQPIADVQQSMREEGP
jgi:hypothetical protein